MRRSLPTIPDVVERTIVVRHKERKFGTGCVEQWRVNFTQLVSEANEPLTAFEQMLLAKARTSLLGTSPVYTNFLLHGIVGKFTYRRLLPFPTELPSSLDGILQ